MYRFLHCIIAIRNLHRIRAVFYAIRCPVAGLSVLLTFMIPAVAQTTVPLPAPDGVHATATRTFHWTHDDLGEPRELMVQLWYPTDSRQGSLAGYAPDYPEWTSMKSHSVENAPPSETPSGLPVIVISPGRGVPRHYYTTLAENLASHGYLAVAIDYPQIGTVRYPDGRLLSPDERFAIPFEVLIGPYEHVDVFFEEATRLGAADLRHTLSQLELLNNSVDDALYGRMNFGRLGTFGHSLGARIAGAVVAEDDRFVAFASMEGVPPAAARRGGLDAAVLMLSSSELPDMAQPNIRELLPNRRNTVYMVTLEGFGHNSPTELPLLRTEVYRYETPALPALQTSVQLIRTFFDEQIKQTAATNLQTLMASDIVRFETFPP